MTTMHGYKDRDYLKSNIIAAIPPITYWKVRIIIVYILIL